MRAVLMTSEERDHREEGFLSLFGRSKKGCRIPVGGKATGSQLRLPKKLWREVRERRFEGRKGWV